MEMNVCLVVEKQFGIDNFYNREGMAQTNNRGPVLDLLITNAIIIDYTGIYKADIGIRNGIIVGIGIN